MGSNGRSLVQDAYNPHQLDRVGDVQLVEHPGPVELDGARAVSAYLGYFSVGLSLDHQVHDLPLFTGELLEEVKKFLLVPLALVGDPLAASAASTFVINSGVENGLVTKSKAPSRMTSTAVSRSPWPVMKITGKRLPRPSSLYPLKNCQTGRAAPESDVKKHAGRFRYSPRESSTIDLFNGLELEVVDVSHAQGCRESRPEARVVLDH